MCVCVDFEQNLANYREGSKHTACCLFGVNSGFPLMFTVEDRNIKREIIIL